MPMDLVKHKQIQVLIIKKKKKNHGKESEIEAKHEGVV